MPTPTDNAIAAYAASILRAYAAGFDYLDLAENMADDDTIGNTRIADLDRPAIDDLQRRILNAMHAWADADHAGEPLRPEYGIRVVYTSTRTEERTVGETLGDALATLGWLTDRADVVSRTVIQRPVGDWHELEDAGAPEQPAPDRDDTDAAWHTIRRYVGPDLFNAVDAELIETTHADECHHLPPWAVCWFDHEPHHSWWPVGLGTWRIRPIQWQTAPDDYQLSMEIQAWDETTRTWHDWDGPTLGELETPAEQAINQDPNKITAPVKTRPQTDGRFPLRHRPLPDQLDYYAEKLAAQIDTTLPRDTLLAIGAAVVGLGAIAAKLRTQQDSAEAGVRAVATFLAADSEDAPPTDPSPRALLRAHFADHIAALDARDSRGGSTR